MNELELNETGEDDCSVITEEATALLSVLLPPEVLGVPPPPPPQAVVSKGATNDMTRVALRKRLCQPKLCTSCWREIKPSSINISPMGAAVPG